MVGEYGTIIRVYYGRITTRTSPAIRVTVRFDRNLKPRTVKPSALTLMLGKPLIEILGQEMR
jgi:hypothetical protein